MKQLKTVSILAAALSLGLTSCGGEAELDAAGGQVAPAAAALLVADPAFTAMLGKIAPQANGTIAAPGLGGVVGLTEAGLLANPFDACTTEEGSKTDGADLDGIPVNFVQKFNCEGITDGAAERAMTGSYTVQDKDDTKYGVEGGFKFAYDVRQSGRYFVGRTYEAIWSGLWEATTTANGFALVNEYTIKSGEDLESPDIATGISARSKFTTTYTPDNMAQPFQSGAIEMSGFYRVTGVMTPPNQTTPRYDLEVSFEISSSGLTYAACGLKDGTFTFTDGAGNKIVYTYTNCALVRQYNGQTL